MRIYQTPDVGGEVVLRCVSMYDVVRAVIPINAAERFAWMVSWDTDMGFSNVPTGRRLHAHLTTLGRHNGYVDRWWQACWRSSLQRRRAMPERYALHAYICLACCMQCKNVSTCRPGDLNNNHSITRCLQLFRWHGMLCLNFLKFRAAQLGDKSITNQQKPKRWVLPHMFINFWLHAPVWSMPFHCPFIIIFLCSLMLGGWRKNKIYKNV